MGPVPGPLHGKERQRYGSQGMSSFIAGEFHMAEGFMRAHSPGLFHTWEHPIVCLVLPPAEGSFDWVMKPRCETVRAKFYTDGSRMDATRGGLARLGWSFVALDPDDRIVAVARGVPPQ